MIELTQEQWHAIAQEENPTVIEPESKTAYIVLRKPCAASRSLGA